MEHPNISEQLSSLDSAVWRILRNAVIRALVQPQGRTTLDVTADEAERLLEPYQQALLHDVSIVREILKQMYVLGVEATHAALMGQPGVDQEMLEQVIAFQAEPRDEEGPELAPGLPPG